MGEIPRADITLIVFLFFFTQMTDFYILLFVVKAKAPPIPTRDKAGTCQHTPSLPRCEPAPDSPIAWQFTPGCCTKAVDSSS